MRLLVLGGSSSEGDDLIWPSDRSRMSAVAVANGVELRVRPAFVRPDTAGLHPLFKQARRRAADFQ